MMDIGDRLRKALEKRGISQAELERMTDIPATQISNYVRNKNEPGSYILYRICSSLEVSADYLLGLKGEDDDKKAKRARRDRKKT